MGKRWTKNEDDLLSKIFSEATPDELTGALPNRTLSSITNRAFILRLNKSPEYLERYAESRRKEKSPKPPKPPKPQFKSRLTKPELNVLYDFGETLTIPELKMMLPRRSHKEIMQALEEIRESAI